MFGRFVIPALAQRSTLRFPAKRGPRPSPPGPRSASRRSSHHLPTPTASLRSRRSLPSSSTSYAAPARRNGRNPQRSPVSPTRTHTAGSRDSSLYSRSANKVDSGRRLRRVVADDRDQAHLRSRRDRPHAQHDRLLAGGDRKSTRLNSSHTVISYAVFCLKKKKH